MSEMVAAKNLLSARPRWHGPEHVDRDADEIEHDRRHVEHVVGPVAPAGEESVEVAEDFFGPEIDAAFAGIAVGEFDDGDALRPEEKKERDDPEPDGDAAVGRDGGDDIEIEDGDYEEEDEIAASEGADQVRLGRVGSVVDIPVTSTAQTAGSSPGLRPVRNDKDYFATYVSSCTCRGGRMRPPLHDLVRDGHWRLARSCWAFASDAAMSSKADRCLSMSASVC